MKLLLFGLLILPIVLSAQAGPELHSFKKIAEKIPVSADSLASLSRTITDGHTTNYLLPLANAYAYKNLMIAKYTREGYYDNLSQNLSFTGDYKAVLECLKAGNRVVDTSTLNSIAKQIALFSDADIADAKSVILKAATSRQVVMINEAHCKPVHRAFTYSLLTDLYSLGFRYLAMETLNNQLFDKFEKLSVRTGYYTCEPVAGELVRKAINMGFKLVSYEDTVYTNNSKQRDSAQAEHLFEILKKDPAAKILVHAGYGHIEKLKIEDVFLPMAYQFKQISGIDPFCIDQTSLTEEGNDGYSSAFYNYLLKAHPVKTVSVLMENNQPVNIFTGEQSYDLWIIHPRSVYQSGRATWYSMGNERKQVPVSNIPRKSFLVQAYYASEKTLRQEGLAIPADQTYIRTKTGSYPLFLRKGQYDLVFRDINYKTVSVGTMVVK